MDVRSVQIRHRPIQFLDVGSSHRRDTLTIVVSDRNGYEPASPVFVYFCIFAKLLAGAAIVVHRINAAQIEAIDQLVPDGITVEDADKQCS